MLYEVKITPAAAVGLLLSHRSQPIKGADQTRAAIDAERWFLDKDPLVKTVESDGVSEDGKPAKLLSILPAFDAERTVRVEKHVYDHLKRCHSAAVEGGEVFGFKRGQGTLSMSSEASAVFEAKPVEVEVEKAPPAPLSLAKPEKKRAAGA